ncbi:HMG box-containing protein 4-like [Acanthaster planci]|uniref:HMG box-containing protein 4-like n=1 Tax=Acanthaster planci TaxID=133434 RepID=A0A8B7ZDD1_ACAPL|nr:HMG box-containing protein 4-like [Acanthaster planci]XP_022102850.1 HMG box-containing protein 4-like [Acanthaster planci]
MASRSRKRKRAATAEVEVEEITPVKREIGTSEEEDEITQDAQTARPSRNRRKSVKLAEAESSVKTPNTEPQRLGVISLHHEKGGKKDSGDSWRITSSNKPRKKSAFESQDKDNEVEEKSQLLHVVSKGKRQQTIKIKPLHKPEPTDEKPTPSRSGKKSHQKVPPPITATGDSNVTVKEDSGIKLKFILSPKDKGKNIPEVEASEGSKERQSASREKSGKSSMKDKDEHVKAKLVFSDQVLKLDGDKAVVGQTKKRKHGETELEMLDTPDTSKGNKKKKTSTEEQAVSKQAGKLTPGSKVGSKLNTKAMSSNKATSKGNSKLSQKPPDKSGQEKTDNKGRTKNKTPDETNSQSGNISKDEDKSKKKKPKANTIAANFNLLSADESIEDLVIDESKSESSKKAKSSKTKSDKKKKSSELDSFHKSKKHKSKDMKKHKAKFINTGTKKPGHSVGLDPVTASHMLGQFDSVPPHPQPSLDLKGPGLDDESFFMAGNDAMVPALSADTVTMGLTELGFPGMFGKMKKNGKKSSKKADKEKKKKKKKEKLKKDGKSKEKKPLSAYMLWCGQTRRKVVAQNPGLDFSGISRMMGTLWQQLPEKEKQVWYRKQHLQNIKHKNVPSLSKQKFRRSSSSGKGSRSPHGSPVRHFSPRTEPIDCAAHFKLLGESLKLVGDRLQNHVGQMEVHGSLSVLLDSTLCVLGPLMSLTSQVPELNCISKESISTTVDNIAYIMPGLG